MLDCISWEARGSEGIKVHSTMYKPGSTMRIRTLRLKRMICLPSPTRVA